MYSVTRFGKVFGLFLSNYLVFGQIVNILWQIFNTYWGIFIVVKWPNIEIIR